MHGSCAHHNESLEQNKNNYSGPGGSFCGAAALAWFDLARESDMQKFLMAAAAVAISTTAFVSLGARVANAGTVCLTDKEVQQNFQSCDFYSFQECRTSAIGIGGTCVRNPYPDEGGYGVIVGPWGGFGSSYNRYDRPVYGGGYVRPYPY